MIKKGYREDEEKDGSENHPTFVVQSMDTIYFWNEYEIIFAEPGLGVPGIVTKSSLSG